MKIFNSYAELRNAIDNDGFRFRPEHGPAGFKCSQCRKIKPLDTGADSFTPGYARTQTDDFICYTCADENQRASLITGRNGPIYAYVSGDGSRVTTWTGGKLGTVIGYGEARSGWHGSTIAYFRVRDVHGQWWSGRGAGRGMACTLRPMRSPV